MKKLAALLTLCSIGLFAIGCTEQTAGPEPIPGEPSDMEGGSGTGGTVVEESETIIEDAPPTTDAEPPVLTPEPETTPEPGTDAAAPSLGEPADTEGTDAAAPEATPAPE